LHADGKSVENISRELEEKHYIFNDDEEHQWNMKVVDNIINNCPVKNRFTGYIFSQSEK
jgi:ribosomal protein S17E